MGDAEVVTSVWRNVELGRVILITQGPYAGKLAAIVEIIDHKRVRDDPPHEYSEISSSHECGMRRRNEVKRSLG